LLHPGMSTQTHYNTLNLDLRAIKQELHQVRLMEKEAITRVTSLELRLEEREREMEKLLADSNEQRLKTVEAFESLLTSERAAKMEAASRAEELSIQLQTVQGELDALQTQLMSVRNHETALDTKLKSYADVPTISPAATARSKRAWVEDGVVEMMNGVEMNVEENHRMKRERVTDDASSFEEVNECHNSNEVTKEPLQPTPTQDYHKLTVAKLKQQLTEAGFGEEVTQIKSNATKKDVIALYEELMLLK
jgi:hypothetical protein